MLHWNKAKKVLKKLADLLNEHWIWKTIILFLPAVYLPVVVKYAGVQVGLSKKNGGLTKAGITITGIIYIVALLINILSNYKSNKDKEIKVIEEEKHRQEIEKYEQEIESYDETLVVYDKLLNVIGNICDVKLEVIFGYINNSILGGTFSKPFNETVCPEKQLKSIAKELKTCLSEITLPPFSQISVSMAYDFPQLDDKLRWIDQQEIAQCMSLTQLQKNENTTFYKIYSGQSNFLFFNDKKIAATNGMYVFDKKDHRSHDKGSIICDEIALEGDNGKIARIILTISTYGYKFTNSIDETILNNMSTMIEEVILQQFEKRIRIELALLFVKKQYNKK